MNIWQLTEYSLAVSIVALLLLLMKMIFHDKLSARWHYFIWTVLFLRMVVPIKIEWLKTPLSLFEEVPVNYWIKLAYLKAERTGILGAVERILPWYFVGAGLLLLYYFVTAIVVRISVYRLRPASEAVKERVIEIAGIHGLKSCSDIRISTNNQAFVSGLLKPVLVLPEQKINDKVIIHELLHKKYGDVWINYVLHFMRVLQWFNPLIWYVTGIILNDSEALCDQRVLEHTAQKDGDTEKIPTEKIYGELLISMAEKRHIPAAKIGTTNMANSYGNMKTRIKRIADFKKVPMGAGFAALCITIILGVSSIGYFAAKNIISSGVQTEKDLENVMLRALTYKAETMEEALYLYLKGIEGNNPIYLLPVMPKEDLAAYEAWIYDMFRQEKFLQWQEGDEWYVGISKSSTQQSIPEWITFDAEIIDNPWFIRDGNYLKACTIYNVKEFTEEETGGLKGSAVLEFETWEKDSEYVTWDVEFHYEDGWKVKRLSEEVNAPGISYHQMTKEPEPVVFAEMEGTKWRIEVKGWNECFFPDIFNGNTYGWSTYYGPVKTTLELEEDAEYPTEFTMSYKITQVEAYYIGENPPNAEEILVKMQVYDDFAWTEYRKETFVTNIKDTPFSSSNGTSARMIKPEEIKAGEPIRINYNGSGDQVWNGTENFYFRVEFFYDGGRVEVIEYVK